MIDILGLAIILFAVVITFISRRWFEKKFLKLYKKFAAKSYQAAETDWWDAHLLGWLRKGGGTKEFLLRGELVGLFFLIFVDIMAQISIAGSRAPSRLHPYLMFLHLLVIAYIALLVWYLPRLWHRHPLVKLRKEIFSAAEKKQKPPVPLFRLVSNVPGRWSTFGQPIFGSIDFSIFPIYALLNQVELDALEHYTGTWVHDHLSRLVLLIDPHLPPLRFSETLELAQKYAEKPEISFLGLFLDKPEKDQKWMVLWEFLNRVGEVQLVKTEQLKAQPALASILTVLSKPILDTQGIAKEMGPGFPDLHHSLANAPSPIAEMYRKICQVDSYPRVIFLLFDCIEAVFLLSTFSLLGARQEIKSRLKNWTRQNTNLRSLSCFILDSLKEGLLPQEWHRHFNRVQKGLPTTLIEQDLLTYKDFLEIQIETNEKLRIRGLAALTSLLRNKTKGHGMITDHVGKTLAAPLFRLLLILAFMLRVEGLRGSREGNEFRIKCDQGDWVVISPLVWSPPDSERVFYLQEVVGSQLIYLDYISGDFSRVNKS